MGKIGLVGQSLTTQNYFLNVGIRFKIIDQPAQVTVFKYTLFFVIISVCPSSLLFTDGENIGIEFIHQAYCNLW